MRFQTLTDRQRELLLAIDSFTKQHQYPPSRRDLVRLIGNSGVNSISYMLKSLLSQGYVTWEPFQGRTIRVLKMPEEP